MDSVLYFPTINLPNNIWTTKSLLYWDDVHVIVPEKITQEAKHYTPFMKTLLTEGLVVQEIVEEYEIHQSTISDSIWKSIKIDTKEKQRRFANDKYWRIHNTKFHPDLLDDLVKNQLALKIDYSWYNVEVSTAKLMMIYLSSVIAIKKNLKLSTDSLNNIHKDSHLGLVDSDNDKIRDSILKEVLPYPENPSTDSLFKFKEKYNDDLRRFRRFIDQQLIVASEILDEQNRSSYIQSKVEEINDRKEQLIGKMNESKLGKIAKSTVKGLIIDAGITVVTGGTIVPAASILGGVNEIIEQYNGKPLQGDELAYLALVEEKLIK